MEFTADTPFSRQMPDGFYSKFTASNNYRMFALFMNECDIEYEGKTSVEILFPWQIHRDLHEDIDNHFRVLISHALQVFQKLNENVSTIDSKVYQVELDKTRCLFRIATMQPQALYNHINEFECPEIFMSPRMQTDKASPQEIIQSLCD